VFVSMPKHIDCLLPLPGAQFLNEIVQSTGASFEEMKHDKCSHTLYLGRPTSAVDDSFGLVCSGWRGGIVVADQMNFELPQFPDFALGGVVAASLGVAHGVLGVGGLVYCPIELILGINILLTYL